MVMQFTQQDHARVAEAIARAEENTSGEIFCVVARQVSSYRDVSLAWAAATAMLLPLGLIPLGFGAHWLPNLSSLGSTDWQAAHAAAREVEIGQALAAYALVQAAVFVGVFLMSLIPAVRRLLTPAPLRRTRVRRAAMQQFLAHGLHLTQARTGVLIFAALADHQVEVIADEGIHACVSPEVWADAVAALTNGLRRNQPVEGMQQAIALCGQVLAEQFPPRPADINEVPDRLVVI
jgi:putative membrane protein